MGDRPVITSRPSSVSTQGFASVSGLRRRSWVLGFLVVISLAVVGIAFPPAAFADATDSLRAAVAAARPSACGSIRSDPLIDRAARQINESTDSYLNFTARAVPETDALPVLKDLGYEGANKTRILSGAAADVASTIKGLLLQGWADLPDCSYTAYGVATLYNARKNVVLATAVLAG